MKDYSNSHITELINEYIHSERDRNILTDRFVNGYTFERLAEKHDMSVSQVKRIVKKADTILLKHL